MTDYSFRNKPRWDRLDLPNIPLFSSKLPKYVTNRLWEYIEKSKQNSEKLRNNKKLAGNLSTSLLLEDKDDWFMKNVLDEIIEIYTNPAKIGISWNKTFKATSHLHRKYVLSSLWANFQKQTEFNPVHDHSGILSFVIWMQIPTNWVDQHNLPIVKESNAPSASNFQFLFTDIIGNICAENILMSKSMENNIIVFPSQLKHQVYPFYDCEEERISISGNVSIDSTSYKEWH